MHTKEAKKTLRLDWCSHKAAKFACENYHYSQSIPAGKLVKIGVWEENKFIGAIIFGRGANRSIGSPFGLSQNEICELVRVALKEHDNEVSRMISIAIKMLRKLCSGIKLIVSYADLDQGHKGEIYKAGNWLYFGKMNTDTMGSFIIHGKKMHPKSIYSKGWKQQLNWLKKHIDEDAQIYYTKGKHKFVYVLDKKMKPAIEEITKDAHKA